MESLIQDLESDRVNPLTTDFLVIRVAKAVFRDHSPLQHVQLETSRRCRQPQREAKELAAAFAAENFQAASNSFNDRRSARGRGNGRGRAGARAEGRRRGQRRGVLFRNAKPPAATAPGWCDEAHLSPVLLDEQAEKQRPQQRQRCRRCRRRRRKVLTTRGWSSGCGCLRPSTAAAVCTVACAVTADDG